MGDTGLDVVTGALSFTGRSVAERLLATGRQVRTLTGHPDRPDPLVQRLDVRPYHFDDPDALAATLQGATTLYSTYWVRFPHRGVGFEQAVVNSRTLFQAAARAGVDRIVLVSITSPSPDSPFPYFRGKAEVEAALERSGVPFSIVRPTVVFGRGDVLVNNIAWLLRRFPVFLVPGSGEYKVRPVHVADVARMCVTAAQGPSGSVIDAVGPETYTFEELVLAVRTAVRSDARLVHVPPSVVPPVARALGLLAGDVLLTSDELAGLMAGLVTTEGTATGHITLTEWLVAFGSWVGRRYASELGRHFDRRLDPPMARARARARAGAGVRPRRSPRPTTPAPGRDVPPPAAASIRRWVAPAPTGTNAGGRRPRRGLRERVASGRGAR
jgi:nucleoside-diphosphate-sugar epimerase